MVGSSLLEHTPRTSSTYYAQHQGQASGAVRVYWACRPRAAWGGMRVLGVFENWAGSCVFDFGLKRPTAILVVATEVVGYRKRPPSVRAYAPTRFTKPHPRAPPPEPRLKPGPVLVASGGLKNGPMPKRGERRAAAPWRNRTCFASPLSNSDPAPVPRSPKGWHPKGPGSQARGAVMGRGDATAKTVNAREQGPLCSSSLPGYSRSAACAASHCSRSERR